MNTSMLLLCFGAFSAVTLLILAFGLIFLDRSSRLDDRLMPLRKAFTADPAIKPTVLSVRRRPTTSTLASSTESVDLRMRLQAALIHAGIYAPWALSVLLSIVALAVTIPLISGMALGHWYWGKSELGAVIGLIVAFCGAIVPLVTLRWLKQRRHAVLMRSLPDFLDLMVACLESGISIDAALLRVVEELQVAHPLLASELHAVKAQIELGAAPDAAIRTFADRADFDALRSLSTVLQQARRFGTGLAEALRTHADEMRIQREQAAEEKAQQASVEILVPTMLLIFPSIFIVLAGPAAIQLAEVFAKPDTISQRPAHNSSR